jgi:hypothetical protein
MTTPKLPWFDLTRPILQTKEWFELPKLYPRAQHHAVLYPGLATPATSLTLLHLALQSKGVVCHEWEQGFNTGITPEVERKALAHLVRLMRTHPNATWHLIGWSLGGLLARELAKVLKEPGLQCTSVTTMGTPINDMPNNKKVLTLYRLLNKELPDNDVFFEKNIYVSPPCHSLSIYSQQDAVVPWKTCIQSPLHKGHVVAINHEVSPGHLAMINHPATWTALVKWMGGNYNFSSADYQAHAENETSAYWSKKSA